jgi:hypothetical protein
MTVVSKKTAVVWLVGLFLLLDIAGASWYLVNHPGSPNLPRSIYADEPIPANAAAQISGVVTAVSNASITVAPFVTPGPDTGETTPVAGSPLPISKSLQQTYTLTPETKIITQVLRDRATFEGELKAYQAAYAKDPNYAGPKPAAYTEKELKISDLKKDVWVTVVPTTAESKDAQTILLVSTGTTTPLQ